MRALGIEGRVKPLPSPGLPVVPGQEAHVLCCTPAPGIVPGMWAPRDSSLWTEGMFFLLKPLFVGRWVIYN